MAERGKHGIQIELAMQTELRSIGQRVDKFWALRNGGHALRLGIPS